MLTSWEYSIETEAERLIYCAHKIGVGFYKTNNFIVLPYSPTNNNLKAVTFPDLPYNQIPRFWEKVAKVNVNPKLVSEVSNLLVKSNLKKPKSEKVKLAWERAEEEVLDEIYKVLPSKRGKIKKIIIYPTVFGTGSSFDLLDSFGKISIKLREDRGINSIVWSIISAITRDDVFRKFDGLWVESQIIADYLVTETAIAAVLQKYEKDKPYIPSVKRIRNKEQASLLQDSNNFYNKLGIPNFHKPFSHQDLVPKLFDKPLNNLTEIERKLIIILIENGNQVVDFDKIGEAIFKTDNDFSLYAISKTIQRLRDKLETNGISGSYIQTLRGKGYMLKN